MEQLWIWVCVSDVLYALPTLWLPSLLAISIVYVSPSTTREEQIRKHSSYINL